MGKCGKHDTTTYGGNLTKEIQNISIPFGLLLAQKSLDKFINIKVDTLKKNTVAAKKNTTTAAKKNTTTAAKKNTTTAKKNTKTAKKNTTTTAKKNTAKK